MTGRVDRLQSEFEIDIQWTAFPLHPNTPAEGMALTDLFAGRNVDIPGMLAHLREVAAQLNLEFGERVNTYNSRMAQELGKWAEDRGRGHDYHMAMFKAYFVDGHNIADTDTLISICRALGIDGDEARRVINGRSFKEEVDRDWQRSRKLGITAVPTFRFDGINLVGAQSYEKLADLLNHQSGANFFDPQ